MHLQRWIGEGTKLIKVALLDATHTLLCSNQSWLSPAQVIMDLNLSLLDFNRFNLEFFLSFDREFSLLFGFLLFLDHLFKLFIGRFVLLVEVFLKNSELLLQI